jgi:hypothetical protein
MIIKDGFNNQPLKIRIAGRAGDDTAEVWLEMVMPASTKDEVKETLSYATLMELLELQRELKRAIQEMVR